MTDEFELYKCKTLIGFLMRRNQDVSLALQNYPKSVYKEALKEMKLKNKQGKKK